MPNFSMKVTPSFKKVGRAFESIAEGFDFQKEIERFSFAIEGGSKKTAPVDTGLMRASIATNIGNLEAKIAPHVYYAQYVHEGTWKMRGRPFMEWGLERAERNLYQNEPPFVASVEKTISNGLREL